MSDSKRNAIIFSLTLGVTAALFGQLWLTAICAASSLTSLMHRED